MLTLPKRITQGETVTEEVTFSDYPAGTWSLRIVFVIDGEQTIINASQLGSTTGFEINISKAVTAAMNVGQQFWQAWVTDGTDRHKVGEGETQIVTDFETQTSGFDARSTLRVQVEAIRSLLMGVATADQKKVKYSDREIENYDRSDLISIYRFLKSELDREDLAAAGAEGRPYGGRVRVRF